MSASLRPLLLTERQAAEVLGLSPRTLQDWRLTGKGPLRFTRLGKSVRYRWADLEALTESLPTFLSTTQADAMAASL